MLGTGAMASLPALVRGLTTSSAAAAAVPAVASSSQGIASMFGFGSARVTTPLSEPLPAAPKPLKGSVPSVAPKLESSSLDAGTKVAAIDTPSPVSTVALVFESGSGFETDATEGASKVLEAMAFKATSNRTTFRLTRELEKIGATASAKAGRESVAFSVSALKMHAPEAVEMLVDSVVNARASYWEVAEAVEAAKAALTAAAKDPNAVLTDVLHRAAFDGALGKPQLVDPSTLDHFTNATLKEFLATLHPSKSVLAAAGVGLSDLKALANPLVDKSGASAPAKPSSTYVGGSLNVLATSPLTHVALAFEAKGGLSDAKAAAAAAVVKQLLDEGRAVLPRAHKEHDVFVSASSFAHLYQSTGLVGITAASAPAQGAALVDAVSKKVEALAKGVTDAQLKVAKQLAVGAYKAQLASSTGLVSTVAPSLLLTGKFDPAAFVSAVDSLTAADVTSFVSKAVKSQPTFVTYGSLAKVPRFDAIAKRFA